MSKQPGKSKASSLKVQKKTISDLSVKNGKAGKVKGGGNTVHGPSCPVCGTGPTPGP
jgi:hypothetical protein